MSSRPPYNGTGVRAVSVPILQKMAQRPRDATSPEPAPPPPPSSYRITMAERRGGSAKGPSVRLRPQTQGACRSGPCYCRCYHCLSTRVLRGTQGWHQKGPQTHCPSWSDPFSLPGTDPLPFHCAFPPPSASSVPGIPWPGKTVCWAGWAGTGGCQAEGMSRGRAECSIANGTWLIHPEC